MGAGEALQGLVTLKRYWEGGQHDSILSQVYFGWSGIGDESMLADIHRVRARIPSIVNTTRGILIDLIDHAEPYAVAPDIVALNAEAAKSLPTVTFTEDLFPCREGIFWLDEPLPWEEWGAHCSAGEAQRWLLETKDFNDKVYPRTYLAEWTPYLPFETRPNLRAITWQRIRFGERICYALGFYFRHRAPLPASADAALDFAYEGGVVLDIGGTWTQADIAAAQQTGMVYLLNFTLSLLLFIKQAVVLPEPRPVANRQMRRTANRVLRREVAPPLVLKLRRIQQRRAEGDATSREYSHRWMVHAHWRAQFYPRAQVHRPKWIHAYTKGPEGKELIIRPRAVEVVR